MSMRAEVLGCLWGKPFVDGGFLTLKVVRGQAPFFNRRRWDLMQRRLIDAELFTYQNHINLTDERVSYAINCFLITGEPIWLATARQRSLAGACESVKDDLQTLTEGQYA